MATFCSFSFSIFVSVAFMAALSCMHGGSANEEERHLYIAYMGSLPQGPYFPNAQHHTILENVLDNSLVSDSLVRNYRRSFNGFAAKLTQHEQQRLARMEGVVSVFPAKTLQLHTTRSWDFMGLPVDVKRQPTIESDVIVGVFDSGIWPESESFSDNGLGPVPAKWKGECNGGKGFTCNKKIIGARYYKKIISDNDTAIDAMGHGSHTASTAAGNQKYEASFYGLAQGTARGGVPSARIAVYKVCSQNGCSEADILAAFDDAIADGVDIISVSLGSGSAVDLTQDVIAIGSFHAREKGILTVNSAGNSGPSPSSIVSVAPWIFTVAASTIDRQIIDKVVLGNGKTVNGTSVNPFALPGTQFPLVYGKQASSKCDEQASQACLDGCLDRRLVKGKIVLCDAFSAMDEAQKAGALGFIGRQSDQSKDAAFVVPFPASALSPENYDTLIAYINSTKRPHGTILRSEAVTNSTAPVAASFSSRGPNPIIPDILKPDISAPGVDILAAFSPLGSPSGSPLDKRSVKYSILSGTSMACPHVTGATAYVKSFHPDWSPSAIKSALMTTARLMRRGSNSLREFEHGSGHIDPIKALNPGLVYTTSIDDYIKMLCSMGLSQDALNRITGRNVTCSKNDTGASSPKDLNYPTMSARIKTRTAFKIQFPRTVTNVGTTNSTYKASVLNNSKLAVSVNPSTLSFRSLNESQSFVVTVAGKSLGATMVRMRLEWSDGTYSVQSPIVLYTDTFDA